MNCSAVLESLPGDVTEFAAHAVDPLEIAADLEASGISNRVARDVYAAADVFELATGLWQEIPFVAAEAEPEPGRRPGNVSDLGRGLVYGAPGLLLFALQHSWDWALPTWVLALAVTWGWGVGQMAANLTYTLRTRHDATGERFLLGVVLVATPVSTIVVVGGVGQVFDITLAATLVATVLTAYMVAAAILVLHEQLLVAALCLLPGVVVAIDALAVERWSSEVVAVTIGVSVLATVVAASRYITLRPRHRGMLAHGESARSLVHLLHGLVCGAALALVVIGGGAGVHRGDALLAVSVPLVLSLGVMEWQLRTFRSGALRLQSATTVSRYAGRTWRLFMRCQARYAAAAFGLCAVAAVASGAVHHRNEMAVLVAAGLLGCVYHLDVTVMSLGRVDLALWAWAAGATAGAAIAGLGWVVSPDPDLWLIASGPGLMVCAITFWVVSKAPACAAVNH
jgi:hypothetical protein